MSAMESNILHNPIKFSIKTNDLEKLKKKPDKVFDKIDISDTVKQETIVKQTTPRKCGFTNLGFKIKDPLIGRSSTCSEVPSEDGKVQSKRQHELDLELVSSKQRKIEEIEDQVIIEPETSSTLVIKALPRSAMSPIVIEEHSILKIFSKCKDVITDKLDEKIDAIDRICQGTSCDVLVGDTDNDNKGSKGVINKISSGNAKNNPSERRSSAKDTKKDSKTSPKSFKEDKVVQKSEKDIQSEGTTLTVKDKPREKKDSHKTEIDNKVERKLKQTSHDTKTKRKISPLTHRVIKQDGKSSSNMENETNVAPKPSSYRRSNTERHREPTKRRLDSGCDNTTHRSEDRHRSRSKGKDRSKNSSSSSRTQKDGNRESLQSLKKGTLSLRDEFMMATRCGVVNPEEELEEKFSHKTFKAPIKDKRNIAEKLQKLFSKTKIVDEKQIIDIQAPYTDIMPISEGQKDETCLEEVNILSESSKLISSLSPKPSIKENIVVKDRLSHHKKGESKRPETKDKYHRSTHKNIESKAVPSSTFTSNKPTSCENSMDTVPISLVTSAPSTALSHLISEHAVIFSEVQNSRQTSPDKLTHLYSKDKPIISHGSSIQDITEDTNSIETVFSDINLTRPATTHSSHIDCQQEPTQAPITHVANDTKQSNFQGPPEQYNVTKMIEKTIIMEPLIKTCNIFFRIKSSTSDGTLSEYSSKKDDELIADDSSMSVIDVKTPLDMECNKIKSATTLFSALDRYLDQSSTVNSVEASMLLNTMQPVGDKTEFHSNIVQGCTHLNDDKTIDDINDRTKCESRGITDRKILFDVPEEFVGESKGLIDYPNNTESIEKIVKVTKSIDSKDHLLLQSTIVEYGPRLEDESSGTMQIQTSKEESNHSIKIEWLKDESKISFERLKSKQNVEWESWKKGSQHSRVREQIKDRPKYSKENEKEITSKSSITFDESKEFIKLLDGSECFEDERKLIGSKSVEKTKLSNDQLSPASVIAKDNKKSHSGSSDSHTESTVFETSTNECDREKVIDVSCSLITENESRNVISAEFELKYKHVEAEIGSVDQIMSSGGDEKTFAQRHKDAGLEKNSINKEMLRNKYEEKPILNIEDVEVKERSIIEDKSKSKGREKSTKTPVDVELKKSIPNEEKSKDKHRKKLEQKSLDADGKKNSINEERSCDKSAEKLIRKTHDADNKHGENLMQELKDSQVKENSINEVMPKDKYRETSTRISKDMEVKKSSINDLTSKEKDRQKSTRRSKDSEIKKSSINEVMLKGKDREKSTRKSKDVEVKKTPIDDVISNEKDGEKLVQNFKDVEIKISSNNEGSLKEKDAEKSSKKTKDVELKPDVMDEKQQKDKEKLKHRSKDVKVTKSSTRETASKDKYLENSAKKTQDVDIKMSSIKEEKSKEKGREKLTQEPTNEEKKKNLINEEKSKEKGREKLTQEPTDEERKKSLINEEILKEKCRENLAQRLKDEELKKCTNDKDASKEKDRKNMIQKPKDSEVKKSSTNEEIQKDKDREMLTAKPKDLELKKSSINEEMSQEKDHEKLEQKPKDVELKKSSINEETLKEKAKKMLAQKDKSEEVIFVPKTKLTSIGDKYKKHKVHQTSDSSSDSSKSRSKHRDRKDNSKSKRGHKHFGDHHQSRKERDFKSKVPRLSDSSTDSSRSRSKLRSNRDYSKSKRKRKLSSDRQKSRKGCKPRSRDKHSSDSSTDSSRSRSKYKRKNNDSKSKGRRKPSSERRKSRKGCKPISRDNSMSDSSTDSSRSRSKRNKNKTDSKSKKKSRHSGNCRHSKDRNRSHSSTDSSESRSKHKRKRDEYKSSKRYKDSTNRQKSGKYSKSKSRDKRTSYSPKERGKYKRNTEASKNKRKPKTSHDHRKSQENIRNNHVGHRMPDSLMSFIKYANRDVNKGRMNELKSRRRYTNSIDDHKTYFRSRKKYTMECKRTKSPFFSRKKFYSKLTNKSNSNNKDRNTSDSLKESIKLRLIDDFNDKEDVYRSKKVDNKEVKVDSPKESSHLKDTITSIDTPHHSLSKDKDETKIGDKSLEKVQIPLEQTLCISDIKQLLSDAESKSKIEDVPSKDDNDNYVILEEKPKLDNTISMQKEKDVQNDIAQRALVERYVCKFLNRFVHNNCDIKAPIAEASKSYKKEILRNRHVKRAPLLSINDQKPHSNFTVNSQCPIMYSSVLPPRVCNQNTNHINYTLQSIPLPTYTNFYPPPLPKNILPLQQYYDSKNNFLQNSMMTTTYLSRPQYIQPFFTNTGGIRPNLSPYQFSSTQMNAKANEIYSLHQSSLDLRECEVKILNEDNSYCPRNSSTSSLINSVLDMDISTPCKSIDSINMFKLEEDVSDKDAMSSCGEYEFEGQEPLDPFEKYAEAPRPDYEHIIKTEVHASAIGKRFEYAYLKSTFCNCVPPNPDEIRMGKSACDENCFNRKIKVECNHSCPVYDLCTNRRFQEQMYANIEPFYSGKEKGWGIRTLGKIPALTFIIEYVGELIDFDEFLHRINDNPASNNHFLMLIQKDMYIDSGYKGNWSRFVNHSCDPNTIIERWVVNGKTRIGLFTKKPISKNEEITIDYQFQQYGSVEQNCYCSSANCTGVMGKVNEKLQEQIKTSAIRHRKELISRIISRKSLKEINHVSEMITVIKEQTLDRDTFYNFLEVLLQSSSHLCIRTFIECGGLDVITSYLDSVSWDDWSLKLVYLQCIDHFKLKKRTLLNSGFTSATVVENWSANPRYISKHILANSLNVDSFNDDNEIIEDSPEQTFIDNEPLVQFSLPNSEEPMSEIENQVQSLASKIKDYFSNEREKFFIPKIKNNTNEFSNEFSANDSESRSISIASSVHADFLQMKRKILQKKCDEVIQKLSKDEFRRLFSERYNKSLVEKNQSTATIDSNDNDNEVPQTIKQILSNVIIKEINRLKQNDKFSAMPIEVQNLDIDKILSGLNIVENEGILSLSTSHNDNMSQSTSLSNYSKSSDDTYKSDQESSLSTTERLPPNWRFCRSEDGRIYYYHSISKKTQWETPIYPWDAGEDDPNAYDFGGAHRYRVTVDDVEYMRARYRENFKEERLREWQRKKFERSLQRKLDLSLGDLNKIKFSREVFKAVKVQMKPYFSSSCKIGRVKSKQDLKFLCEKFAETIITKEVKLVANLEDLELNIDVGSKIKLYIKKYMSQQGPFYKRSKAQAGRPLVVATPNKGDSVCTPMTSV